MGRYTLLRVRGLRPLSCAECSPQESTPNHRAPTLSRPEAMMGSGQFVGLPSSVYTHLKHLPRSVLTVPA
jgi:hypothetical protein